mgnify:CR=1 FL=1
MQKHEWFIAILIFVAIFSITSSVDAYHTITGRSTHYNITTNQTNVTEYVQAVRANRTIQINLTHTECINQACVVINSTGIDQCSTNVDCLNQTNMTHLACVNQACIPVNGTGPDECIFDLTCQNQTGGGNQSNRSGGSASLPLAQPAQAESERPKTLFYYLLRFFGIT